MGESIEVPFFDSQCVLTVGYNLVQKIGLQSKQLEWIAFEHRYSIHYSGVCIYLCHV
jgi:hypothetical protein